MSFADYAIQHVTINGTDLGGVEGVGSDNATEVRSPHTDGSVHQTLHYIRRYAPSARFTTRQIGSAMDILASSTDAPVAALNGTTGLVMRSAQQASQDVGYASGSVHEIATALRGVLFARQLAWNIDGGATLDIEALLISADGDAAAIARAAGTLPTQLTPAEGWDLSGLTLSSSASGGVDGLQDVVLSMDPGLRQRWNGVKPYPTLVDGGGATQVGFALEFSTSDRALTRAIGAGGSAPETVVATLKQWDQGGALGSTTQTFTLTNCLIVPLNQIDVQAGATDVARFRCVPRYDGATKPLTWS